MAINIEMTPSGDSWFTSMSSNYGQERLGKVPELGFAHTEYLCELCFVGWPVGGHSH